MSSTCTTQDHHNLDYALEVMGFTSVRDGQQEIIDNVMYGRNTLAVMPTGRGKSATFILPTLANRWRCLVFSPLIALQQDQVSKLKEKGIAAECVNSNNSPERNQQIEQEWMAGRLQFLYAAPERLASYRFRELLGAYPPNLVVVDEVHVAGSAGEDFRPSYKKIADVIKQARSTTEVAVLCLTATLTPENEANVRRILHIEDAKKLTYWESRTNLEMKSLKHLSNGDLAEMINNSRGSVIVYATSVATIEKELYPALAGKIDGGTVTYHGKLKPEERKFNMQMFMTSKAKCVLATNAFGMGVDKPDIRCIIHLGMPPSVEDYVQESGRAGRDGKPAKCILAPTDKSMWVRGMFIRNSNPLRVTYERVWRYLVDQSVNGKQPVTGTIAEIAESLKMGKNEGEVATVINVLAGNGLLVRNQADYRDAVVLHGKSVDSQPDWVKDVMHRLEGSRFPGDDTIKKSPKEMQKLTNSRRVKDSTRKLQYLNNVGLISYYPASRGKTTTVKADKCLDTSIDWNRLDRKRKEENRIFDEMKKFYELPDEDKHEAIDRYFKTGSIE